VDAILDEIDEVLEENAEEFVRSYVQKGGQWPRRSRRPPVRRRRTC
jgi:ubiquitin-like protein Pup